MTYLVDHDQPFGTYQLSNENSCSWYEFATEILKDKDVEVAPVDSSAYPAKAYRPRHSVMSLKKAEDTGFEIIDWQTAFNKFIEIANKNIKTLYFRDAGLKKIKDNENVIEVHNWGEIYKYIHMHNKE